MKSTSYRALLSVLAVLGGAVVLTSCVDEQIIYRERPLFDQPVSAAMDFVGYTDTEDKLTVCGNCHIGQQSEWEGTAHADAWAGLQSSDNAASYCEGCHTVNSLGNVVEEDADGGAQGGYAAVEDDRYHDVQCESCHGAGLPHIGNPDAIDTRPMAPIEVGTELSYGCGQCHSGTHNPFVEEWESSPHGDIPAYPAGRDESAGGCFFCHSGEGRLMGWGVKADYLEKEALLASDAEFAQITCAVCHDPHDATNESQLRFPVNTPSIDNHLCAQCHDRRTVPDPESSHGLEPHAPEADLLIGQAGWIPPGSNVSEDTIRGTHGSERNDRLCATCHVAAYQSTDTAGVTTFSVGHGFRAIPCVDPTTGLPDGTVDCEISTTARAFDGCVSGQCHGDATVARTVLNSALISILDRFQTLEELLQQVDANGGDAGGEIDPDDPTFTVAEGAFFNAHLAHHGTELVSTMTRADSLTAFAPSATHNPFLLESLLIWSIQAVEKEYGVTADPAFDPTPLVKNHPQR